MAGAFLAAFLGAAFFTAFLGAAFFAAAFLGAAFFTAFFAVFFAGIVLCRWSSRSMFVFSSGVNVPRERVARTASPRRPPKAFVTKSSVARRTMISCEYADS